MPKIKVEINIIDNTYCGSGDEICPMCIKGNWCTYYCALFNSELITGKYYSIRCDKCKQAEERG